MKDGFYKVKLKAVSGQPRIETCISYIMTTLWNGVEYLGEDETEECYRNIGAWALSITTHSARTHFDLVMKLKDDNITEFWYVDGRGTIKKVFD